MTAIEDAKELRVFLRTVQGQKAAINSIEFTKTPAVRLLLMVNGVTPLRDLMALAPELDDPQLVDALCESGLIAAVDPNSQAH